MACQCKGCGGSGRLWFRVDNLPDIEMPPGCTVLLDNAAVLPISDFMDPDAPLESADMLTAKVIAFELRCPECEGAGFHQKK